MALVPFRVAGPALGQDLEQLLVQIGPHAVLLRQRPRASGARPSALPDHSRHIGGAGNSGGCCFGSATAHIGEATASLPPAGAAAAAATGGRVSSGSRPPDAPDLSNVGLLMWQSSYVLADFLLLRLPALAPAWRGGWAGARVLELGCGPGALGLLLARAGAQVVLTDLPHILPLTEENIAANFCGGSGGSGGSRGSGGSGAPMSSDGGGGDGGGGDHVDVTARLPAVSAGEVSRGHQLSAEDAFAAAFCPPGSHRGDTDVEAAHAPLEQQPASRQAAAVWEALQAAGPLAVEYSWGEPAATLHQRMLRRTNQEQLQASSGTELAVTFDAIVGADLLYLPHLHRALLDSLAQLCAPHASAFLAFRARGLGEEGFVALAAAAGCWALEEVPPSALHEEFRCGTYRVLALTKLG